MITFQFLAYNITVLLVIAHFLDSAKEREWTDTAYTVYEGSDAIQQPAGRVGNPMDIANMVLFLCSDKAGFITGENICIDGGMTRQMIYHGDNGWTLKQNRQ